VHGDLRVEVMAVIHALGSIAPQEQIMNFLWLKSLGFKPVLAENVLPRPVADPAIL
jgi:hypothetical protein